MNTHSLNTTFLDIPYLNHFLGELCLPGSKSITNRALLLAALARGTTHLHNLWIFRMFHCHDLSVL